MRTPSMAAVMLILATLGVGTAMALPDVKGDVSGTIPFRGGGDCDPSSGDIQASCHTYDCRMDAHGDTYCFATDGCNFYVPQTNSCINTGI